jgi:phosphatidylglycerophosphatase A
MTTTPVGRSEARAPVWASLIATLFGIGRLRPGPGTWASAITVLLWAAVAHAVPPTAAIVLAIALATVIISVGIFSSSLVARASGSKDPQTVVIDEMAGQLIALIAVPVTWKTFLAGFILFRAFDIIKPPPVRQLERLPEGTGIVLDDVAAGIYALIVMQILLRFFHLLK